MLNIKSNGVSDETITSIQHHIYNPYTTSFNYSDEIRIAIQQQDLYVLPHDSYIYIEGVINANIPAGANDAGKVVPHFVNNAIAYLFDEIRYELNGIQIDSCKNVGIISTIKGYISFRPNDLNRLKITGWNTESNTPATVGNFNFCIPLKHIFGFAEDYQNIILNSKHELVVVRSRSDSNAFVGANNISTIQLNKIQWRMPHVNVSDSEKLRLLKFIDKKQSIPMHFRSWELYEYPALPQTDKHIWSVKTSAQVNTPRYAIIGFQTNKNNRIQANKSHFDHCGLRDIKVYLNSEYYPYENLNLNFENNMYLVLYDMYMRFQKSYYHNRSNDSCTPLWTFDEFKTIAPLVVIDCSRQNESLKKSMIDIRIEMQMTANVPANTIAYCLIIHESIVTYNPYTNIVNRSI